MFNYDGVVFMSYSCSRLFFFFNLTATPEIYTLSLHDALPISAPTTPTGGSSASWSARRSASTRRSEEHTSELQSPDQLVCRLLLEKKNRRNRLQLKRHSLKSEG